eukprot:6487678-Amphidinium_carterae.1
MSPYTYCDAAFWPSTRTLYDIFRARCVTPGRLSWTTRSWPSCSELSTSSMNSKETSYPSRSGMEALASRSSSKKGSSITRGPLIEFLPYNRASHGTTPRMGSGHLLPRLPWTMRPRSSASQLGVSAATLVRIGT